MGQLGNLGQMFSTLGGDVLSGAQALGSDVMTGIGDIGSSLSGLFGGGGAVSPGTLGASGAQLANASPSAMGAGVDAVADVAAPTAATNAASLMTGPGAAVNALDTSGIGQGIMNPVGMVDQTSSGLLPTAQALLGPGPVGATGGPTVTGINQGVLADVGQGVQTVPGLPQGNFLQSLLKNPKLLAEGGLLGAELLNANKTPTGEAQLKALAAQQAGFAKNQGELAQAEQQGLLPAGATNLFQGQLQAAEAAIRAKYAQMGMTGSTAEMQDLQAARTGIMGQMFQEGQQMAQQGWTNVNQATGYESSLLDEILATETQQGTALGQALAAFAGAAAK